MLNGAWSSVYWTKLPPVSGDSVNPAGMPEFLMAPASVFE